MTALAALADDLAVDPGDVAVIATQHGADPDRLTDRDCADVRRVLDVHGVRTVPALWWPGSDPDAGSGATRMR